MNVFTFAQKNILIFPIEEYLFQVDPLQNQVLTSNNVDKNSGFKKIQQTITDNIRSNLTQHNLIFASSDSITNELISKIIFQKQTVNLKDLNPSISEEKKKRFFKNKSIKYCSMVDTSLGIDIMNHLQPKYKFDNIVFINSIEFVNASWFNIDGGYKTRITIHYEVFDNNCIKILGNKAFFITRYSSTTYFDSLLLQIKFLTQELCSTIKNKI